MLSYYKNTGTLTNPDFTIITNKFGGMKPIDSIGYQYLYDDTFAIIGYYPVYEKSIYSKPRVIDVDGDGIKEILVGNSLGTLRMYEVDGKNPTSKFKQIDSFHFLKAFQGQKFYNLDLGSYIAPCLADLNGDTVPEIIVGCNRGGVQYFRAAFRYQHKVSVQQVSYRSIAVYPNPAADHIEFNIPMDNISSVEVFNSLGQAMPVTLSASGQISIIDTKGLDAGFYIIRIHTGGDIVYTSKFQVITAR